MSPRLAYREATSELRDQPPSARGWRSGAGGLNRHRVFQIHADPAWPRHNDSFNDRIGAAAKAREKALEQLRSRASPSTQNRSERVQRHAQRATLAMLKGRSGAQKLAMAAAKAAKAIADAPPTEAERKAARDARYVARKARK